MIAAPSCVVPLAPDFEDPPKEPNFYPYFVDSDPVRESTVSFNAASLPYPFAVVVGDQNVRDVLYYRWVADYPVFVPNTTRLVQEGPVPPSSGLAETRTLPVYMVRCESFAMGMEQHRLSLIVSDRPFLKVGSGELRYSQVATRPGPGNSISPVTYPATAGWSITCLP